jgi:AcrR family transcriptional regulator
MNERSFCGKVVIRMGAVPRRETTRDHIISSAHDLFIKQGYHGTSMRQIAQGANLALGGLYNHFSSKEQVFEAVFLAFHPYHEFLPMIAGAEGNDLEQLVMDAAQRLQQVVENHPDYLNLMFIEVVEFKSVHSRKLFSQLFPQGVELLQNFVEAFPEQIRPVPSSMLLRTFLGLFFGYYLTELTLAPAAPVEFKTNAMKYFVDIYLHGILAETSPHPS